MKKLIFLIMLIPTFMINAQYRRHFDSGERQVIRLGTNPGSVMDGTISMTFDWVNKFRSGIEVGLTTEYVELTPIFVTGGFQGNFPVVFKDDEGFETLVGIETLFMYRGREGWNYRNEDDTLKRNVFGSVKLKAIARFNLEWFDFSLVLSGQTRPDLVMMWNGDRFSWGGHVKFGFKFY